MTDEIFCSKEMSLEPEGELRHRDLAQLVKKANRFSCGVLIRVGRQRADGKSIMAVSGLAFGHDPSFIIETWGADARECLWALTKTASRCLKRSFTEELAYS